MSFYTCIGLICLIIFQVCGFPNVKNANLTSEESDEKADCMCGIRNEESRIVGGEDTINGEFPYRCNFQRADGAFCGCSIIGKKWALTAGHCTNHEETLKHPSKAFIDVGDYDISRRDESKNRKIHIKKIHQYPQYDPETQKNDLSLLELESDLVFDKTVSPVCLPFQYRDGNFHGENVIATGWGTTEENGMQAMILQKVELPILTSGECKGYYPGRITEKMICTYHPGKDTCQGDSGGSIDWLDKKSGRYFAIGVVSWGQGCAREGKPGVYTKIYASEFLDWISLKTKNDNSICQD